MTDFLIAETDFGTFAIPRESAHRWPARTVLNGRRWEPETTDAICKYAKSGDVIHAGSFFGDALPAMSRSLVKRALLMAFEPNRVNFEAAEETVRRNGLSNVILRNQALGDKTGDAHLRTRDADGDALGSVSHLDSCGDPVRLVRLDDMARNLIPSVIHLDLEGWELPALNGATRTINRCLPVLILEARKATGAEPYLRWCAENVAGVEYKLLGEVEGNVILGVKGS